MDIWEVHSGKEQQAGAKALRLERAWQKGVTAVCLRVDASVQHQTVCNTPAEDSSSLVSTHRVPIL